MKHQDMIFTHDYASSSEELKVVYIEYQAGRPHSVVCSKDGYCRNFDFEESCYDKDHLMYYHSGGGGSIKELQAPHYAEGYSEASYWMHEDASFSKAYKPINIKKLDKPIEIRDGITNPFHEDFSHEIYGISYCKFCEKWYDENDCDYHHVWDNEAGVLKYIDGTEVD